MTPPSTPTPVGLLQRALDQAAAVIDRVGPADLDRSTPCPAFDVRTLLGHMVFAAERVGAAGRRDVVAEDGPAVAGVADGGWPAAFATAAAAALEAWNRPGATDGTIELPFGTFPAAVVAQIYAIEEATHAWDLAAALGQRADLDAALAADVLAVARDAIRPDYRGPEPMPFAAEVPAPADAAAPDRLAAFMGRDPAAWPEGRGR